MPPSVVTADTAQLTPWQQAVKSAIRDAGELCRRLGLPDALAADGAGGATSFPVFVPLGFLNRMRPGDETDPLLLQVLPRAAELHSPPGFADDPVGDLDSARSPGLLHKYRGRTLMVTTGACAVHCRYCFRRHFPYSETPRSVDQWRPAIAQIAADSTIHEVILSGGDPLMLVDETLTDLVEMLAAIPHLTRLRVHTRVPIMIPERVNDELLAWLTGTRLTPVMVVHANHPAELDADVAAALGRLVDAGIPTLNQAVLLRGINDSADTLAQLCERLVDLRVMPYYLSQLDRVRGAAHFEVPVAEGLAIMSELRRRVPGYVMPRYVQEIAGEDFKTLLG